MALKTTVPANATAAQTRKKAPQVYSEADTLRNLKSRLAKGLIIKCTKCNLKGDAFVCYIKSCRWDYVCFTTFSSFASNYIIKNYLPQHCASRAEPLPKLYQSSSLLTTRQPRNPILCGYIIPTLLKKNLSSHFIAFPQYWNPSVTHVLASKDVKGACTRTVNVIMDILNGKGIIIAYFSKLLKAIDEEPFDIHVATQRSQNGPKTAKLKVATNVQHDPANFALPQQAEVVRLT
ncbi:BnaCnng58240D [Brassica napus]|uniref:(rape) hypothetical protein n=1 Tax=Brassica napus TaxID=3708 RepID=A0A078JS87_BRANA|nr:unnamed protein product [Brassica napus]CDY68257.1 BnaCnng58240D [Brassica napus]